MLPDLSLTAVVSDRAINLNALGRKTVLIFHGQDTAKAALEVNNTVRAAYPDPGAVLVASVIDLRQFPSMFHAMVRPELEKAYHKAAGKLPDPTTASDLIVLLPDWKGTAHTACNVQDSTKQATVLVADETGRVVARCQDGDLGASAVSALREI